MVVGWFGGRFPCWFTTIGVFAVVNELFVFG
jgi:hypothetical protein